MIGEKIGESTGKTTGRRVVPNGDGNHGMKMELSMEEHGKLFGTEVVNFGTYDAILENGHLNGTANGIGMTKDGESIQWTATGRGRFTGKGMGVQWRGSIYYSTQGKLASKVNGQCFVFEYDVDETGNNTQGRVFEWK